LAEAAAPLASIVDPDHPTFILPANMPETIADYCRRTEQPIPLAPGAVVRCCLESLALRYRWVLERLEEMLGRRLEVIHIVGGGCQNTLLCQLATDACNRPVQAGAGAAAPHGDGRGPAAGLGGREWRGGGRRGGPGA